MTSSSPPPAGSSGPAGGSGNRKRWWIIGGTLGCAVLAVIVLVVALGAVWYFVLRQAPEDTAETYFDAYVNQDCAAYEESTTESYRDRDDEDYSCESWVAALQENPVTYEEEIDDVVIDGDEASVRVSERIHDDDGTYEGVYDLEMIKEDGRWLIDGVTTVEEYEEV